MTWLTEPIIGFDLECTGPDPSTAIPVSIAFVTRVGEKLTTRSTLVHPGCAIPPESTAIHGITDEQVRSEGMNLKEAMTRLKSILSDDTDVPLVGCNLAYDLTIVDRLVGLDGWHQPVLDVFVLDKQADRYRKGKRTLGALAEHYAIDADSLEVHSSAGDAAMSILVLLAMAQEHSWIQEMAPWELHQAQIEWAEEQKRSLSEYFVNKGQPAIPESDFGWPIRRAV